MFFSRVENMETLKRIRGKKLTAWPKLSCTNEGNIWEQVLEYKGEFEGYSSTSATEVFINKFLIAL